MQFNDEGGVTGANDLVVNDVIRANELQVWFVAEHSSMSRARRRCKQLTASRLAGECPPASDARTLQPPPEVLFPTVRQSRSSQNSL
jgi:hypothetical protein